MIRKYKDWQITSEGGFVTCKRFEAEKFYGDPPRCHWIWAFKLKDIKRLCDMIDNGEEIPDIYTKPIYI